MCQRFSTILQQCTEVPVRTCMVTLLFSLKLCQYHLNFADNTHRSEKFNTGQSLHAQRKSPSGEFWRHTPIVSPVSCYVSPDIADHICKLQGKYANYRVIFAAVIWSLAKGAVFWGVSKGVCVIGVSWEMSVSRCLSWNDDNVKVCSLFGILFHCDITWIDFFTRDTAIKYRLKSVKFCF